MKITEIGYKRTINLGNYESCSLDMRAQVAEGDDIAKCSAKIVSLVHEQLGLKVEVKASDIAEITEEGNILTKEGKEIETNEHTDIKHEEKKTKKKKAKKKAPKKEEPKKEKPKKEKKEKKGADVPYDRENAVHKQELIFFLDEEYGEGWNKGDKAASIKEASSEMVGEDFLSAKGKLLSSFTEAFAAKVEEKEDGGL